MDQRPTTNDAPLTNEVPRIACELALQLRAVNVTYAAMPLEEVVEAGELLLFGIIRTARSGETAWLDAHLGRVAALRADQLMSESDVRAGFVELRTALASVVATLPPSDAEREPDLETLLQVATEAERKLAELLRSPR